MFPVLLVSHVRTCPRDVSTYVYFLSKQRLETENPALGMMKGALRVIQEERVGRRLIKVECRSVKR